MSEFAIAIGVLALSLVLIGVAFRVSRRLPEHSEVRSEVTYPKPPADVWAAILDYKRHPLNGKATKKVSSLPSENGHPAWSEELGLAGEMRVATQEEVPPRSLVRVMAHETLPFKTRWSYTLEPSPAGCRLTLKGEAFVKRSLAHVSIQSLIAPKHFQKLLDAHLDQISQSLGVVAQRELPDNRFTAFAKEEASIFKE